jgi:hypothetical protein
MKKNCNNSSCSSSLDIPSCPQKNFPLDCGHIPSFYTTTSLQVLCPQMPIYFVTNPSLPTQDTVISKLLPGNIEILNGGYYDIQFIVLISGIGSNIANCSTTNSINGCGLPSFAIVINGREKTATSYSLSSTTGQLYGIGSYYFKQGDIISVVNTSLCPVSIGVVGFTPFANIKNNIVGACGIGGVSASIQLTYRGSPKDIPIDKYCCNTYSGNLSFPFYMK